MKRDREILSLLKKDLKRQQESLVLIPSENSASEEILRIQSAVIQNKYAEGFGTNRYYNGCSSAIEIEYIAEERAKKLFNADYANVQPLSGALANMAAYYALLEPGDKLMGLELSHGGHLSHGLKINFTGRYYKIVSYQVNRDTEVFDYDDIKRLAIREKPKIIVAGASAYPRIIDFKRFREIADATGAYLLADISHIAGLIAAGLHPAPFPYADVVTTTTHKTLRGPRGAIILSKKKYADKIRKAVFPGVQAGPFMHQIAAKAVCFFEAAQPSFIKYQQQVIDNAQTMATRFKERDFRLVSGGTDNHLMLIDLRNKGISGKEAANILEKANIITNKNTIPFDKKSPIETSGIRPGTPALTSRGFGKKEIIIATDIVCDVLEKRDDKTIKNALRQVKKLCRDFPIYEHREI